MNRPLKAFEQHEPEIRKQGKVAVNVIPIKSGLGHPIINAPSSSVAVPLHGFRYNTTYPDSKFLDYLLIGILTLFFHTAVVHFFKEFSVSKEEQVEPVKIPHKVHIEFVQPKQPIVQTPPPPPKVVPLKKPPKPKVKPKSVVKRVEPPPVNVPTVETQESAPVVSAPPAPPPTPKVEKVTQPSAGAGYLHNPAPVYPEVAEERGWEGRVLMKVHVLAGGRPDSVSVVKSSGKDILDAEAVRTVKKWSFVPAKRGTTPIDGWVTVPITFNLQG